MARKVNMAGFDLVKEFEALYTEAYVCPAGVWTIGYGHTGKVRAGDKITRAQAEDLLEADLDKAGADVERLVNVALTDNQYAALVSFVFNLGAGSLASSTLLRRLNAEEYDDVPSEMARWVKATDPATGKKRVLKGLQRRRAAEGELWLSDNDDTFVNSMGMPQAVSTADDNA